jgi:hypothetical protein
MSKPYLIQTIDNRIQHDFSFNLIKAIEYQNWYNRDNDIKYHLTDKIYDDDIDMIPIGSVEFVDTYLKTFHDFELLPINIPDELFKEKYLKRNVIYGRKENINKVCFVKSAEHIKLFADVISPEYLNLVPNGKLLISDIVDIDSEYRCFVFENELVGIKHYFGDFKILPDINTINDMIADYKSAPIAYTLDVGITKMGTVIIECHNFVSVGLYGFADYKILPQMFYRSFNEIIKLNSKS